MSSVELETSVYLMVAKEVGSLNSSLNTTLSYLCADRDLRPAGRSRSLLGLRKASTGRQAAAAHVVSNQILGNQWVNSSPFFLFWVTGRVGGSVAEACGLWREKAWMRKDQGESARHVSLF